jgi:PAS domain
MSGLPQKYPTQAEPTEGFRDERRLVERVLRYWTELATRRGFPRRDDIDPWMIGDDWMNCLLVAVRSPIDRSYFIAVGENLISADSQLPNGTSIARFPSNTLASAMLSLLPQVLSARRCLLAEGMAKYQGTAILYRSALLPLSEDGAVIDHALGASKAAPTG